MLNARRVIMAILEGRITLAKWDPAEAGNHQ
jgi:hypothetical protein